MTNMKLSEELKWRGFINQTTYSDIKVIDGEPITFYWGVDPSADSMQAGNFAIAMMIKHFIKHGHKPILLVGGATGIIGDPGGKDVERELKALEVIKNNKASIANQYKKIFGEKGIIQVDNYEWFKDMTYIDFLRTVGKNAPLSQMLGREFVKSRLGSEGSGISYAEFSYSLMQGYDFVHLFKKYGATLQVCGADQWGNCIAGVELIRKMEGGDAHVWSAPLVINKTTGRKFGKSEDGAVWLKEERTSVFRFYQFWLNSGDLDVEDYLKIYTELEKPEIDRVMSEQRKNPGQRPAQKRLALEVTTIVHGAEKAESVKNASEALFGLKDYKDLGKNEYIELARELPIIKAKDGDSLVDILVKGKLASSKTEAKRFLDSSAVYINGSQIPMDMTTLEAKDAIHGYVVVRRGKNESVLVSL
ncbi:MAG: tyrosine--tRNA ligase [Patescibacteria group bacterium]